LTPRLYEGCAFPRRWGLTGVVLLTLVSRLSATQAIGPSIDDENDDALRKVEALMLEQVQPKCGRYPVFGAPYNNSEQQKPRDILDLNDTHTVLIGDSITRYIYVGLVHLLHTGYHVPRSDFPSLLNYRDHDKRDAYGQWANYTNAYFSGQQICDCYHGEENIRYDNRYWRDDCRNTTLTYLGKYGILSIQGHFNTSTVYQERPESINLFDLMAPPPTWAAQHVLGGPSLRNRSKYLQPKPKYVYFNAGFVATIRLGSPFV